MRQRLEFKKPTEPEYIYNVLIKQENGKHYCRLNEYKSKFLPMNLAKNYKNSNKVAKYYDFVQFVDFDINTVIGDFINICKDNEYSKDWKKHPFFFGRDFSMLQVETNTTAEIRYIARMRPPLPLFCQDINNVFGTQNSPRFFNIDEFEIIKSFYGVQLNYEVMYKSDGELREFEKLSPIPLESVPEKDKFAIGFRQFAYGLNSIDDIQILQVTEKLYDYKCNSLSEIFFSVWHYCIVNGLKFVHCQHCGRIFATSSLKEKYCPRNSVYKGFEHLSCELAVKNIEQKLRRRKKSIYNYWNTYVSDEKVRNFLNECCKFSDKIKQHASIENMAAYESYLYSDTFPQRWSKKV